MFAFTISGRGIFLLFIMIVALFAGANAARSESGQEVRDSGPVEKEVENRRELLPIPFATREKLLQKMNQKNLGALGEMLAALARDDFAAVARLANELSYSAKTEKLSKRRGSVAFATMATNFHGQNMPALRRAAERRDRRQVLEQMSEAVSACVACHAAVRLTEWPEDRSYPVPAPVRLPAALPEPTRRIPDYTYRPR